MASETEILRAFAKSIEKIDKEYDCKLYVQNSNSVKALNDIKEKYKLQIDSKVLYEILDLEKKILEEKTRDRELIEKITHRVKQLENAMELAHTEKIDALSNKDVIIKGLHSKIDFFSEQINVLIRDKEEREQKIHLIEKKAIPIEQKKAEELDDLKLIAHDDEELHEYSKKVNYLHDRLRMLKFNERVPPETILELENKINEMRLKLKRKSMSVPDDALIKKKDFVVIKRDNLDLI